LIASAALAAKFVRLAPGKPAGQTGPDGNTAWCSWACWRVVAIAIGAASGSNGSPDQGKASIWPSPPRPPIWARKAWFSGERHCRPFAFLRAALHRGDCFLFRATI
jgi:hypothetical protein